MAGSRLESLTLRGRSALLEAFADTIKQLRSAVVAGSIWLVTLWFLARNAIDPRYSHSLVATNIPRLAHAVGQIGTLLLLFVVATALGLVSQQVFRAPAIWVANAAAFLIRLAESFFLMAREKFTASPPALRRFQDWESIAVDLARRIVARHAAEIASAAPNGQVRKMQHLVYRTVDAEIFRELNDRVNTSSPYINALDDLSALRLAVTVPMIGLSIAISANVHWYLILLLLAPAVIAFQAVDYRRQRDYQLEQAVWPRIDLMQLAATL
jgi:hypothetical protein